MPKTSGQHQARTNARRKALQILFQSEITGASFEDILEGGLWIDEVGMPCDFATTLLQGVGAHSTEIDELIEQTSANWSLERMPLVDRAILRIATFEMLFLDDIPCSVSINEAVELAKSFGGEDESSRFVNGVLGKIAEHLEGQQDEGSPRAETKVGSRRGKKALHE
jgi:N utilization substance protein B